MCIVEGTTTSPRFEYTVEAKRRRAAVAPLAARTDLLLARLSRQKPPLLLALLPKEASVVPMCVASAGPMSEASMGPMWHRWDRCLASVAPMAGLSDSYSQGECPAWSNPGSGFFRPDLVGSVWHGHRRHCAGQRTLDPA